MEGLLKLSTLVIVCMLVTSPLASKAEISCPAVTSNLAQCFSYLTGGTRLPGCCPGVQRVNNMARTALDRQQTCFCLQKAAKTLGSQLISSRASSLPSVCNVKISYPISAGTNCNNIK